MRHKYHKKIPHNNKKVACNMSYTSPFEKITGKNVIK